MICQRALSLLDDLLDNELSAAEAAEVRAHLDACPNCRRTYDESRRLKELLKHTGNRDPGEDYWLETSQLILARTVQLGEPQPPFATGEEATDRKGAFVQAMVSLAASLVIFVSAMIVGMNQSHAPSAVSAEGPLLLSSAASHQLEVARGLITEDERQRLAKGMLLMGPPGLLGHVGGLTQLRVLTTPDNP